MIVDGIVLARPFERDLADGFGWRTVQVKLGLLVIPIAVNEFGALIRSHIVVSTSVQYSWRLLGAERLPMSAF